MSQSPPRCVATGNHAHTFGRVKILLLPHLPFSAPWSSTLVLSNAHNVVPICCYDRALHVRPFVQYVVRRHTTPPTHTRRRKVWGPVLPLAISPARSASKGDRVFTPLPSFLSPQSSVDQGYVLPRVRLGASVQGYSLRQHQRSHGQRPPNGNAVPHKAATTFDTACNFGNR